MKSQKWGSFCYWLVCAILGVTSSLAFTSTAHTPLRSVLSHSPHRLISIHAIGRFCHILDAAAPLFFPACVFSFLVRLVEKVFGKVLQRPIILVEAAIHGQHPLSPSGSFGTPGGVFLAEG